MGLTNWEIIEHLDAHSIRFSIYRGQLIAYSIVSPRKGIFRTEAENVTGWPLARLYAWLGY